MSPSTARFASVANDEFSNAVGSGSPALAQASALAGMVPPLATIAVRLLAAPPAMIQLPGRWRFRYRKAAQSAYVTRCNTFVTTTGM